MNKLKGASRLTALLAVAAIFSAVAGESVTPASNGVNVTVNGDDFAARYEYSSPAIHISGDGNSGVVLVVAVKKGGQVGAVYLTGFVMYSDDWRRYSKAIFKGGEPAALREGGKDVVSCSSRPCSLSETFHIDVTEAQIKKYAEDGKLSIQLRGQSADNFIVDIPVAYLEAVKEISRK